MEVTVKARSTHTLDIEPEEAFWILCKTLNMDFVLDEINDFWVDESGLVWIRENGHDREVDDRGDLFIALRNVAVNMFPNLPFRNDPYIYERRSD